MTAREMPFSSKGSGLQILWIYIQKYKFIIYVCEKIVKDLLKFSLLFSIIREILIENHRVESQMPEIFKKSQGHRRNI